MESTNEIEPSIREKFDCTFANGEWTIKCRQCRKGWNHPNKPMAVGTILHLLDHAASHE